MTGNPASNPSEPRFLLDESLTPAVASALRLVGYDFVDVVSQFGRREVKDPEIIDWCRENAAIWVHADDRARREHREPLQTSGIRTLWIKRPGGIMSGKEQLRILSFVLPRLLGNRENRRDSRHYCATAVNPTAAPSLQPIKV